MTLTLDRVILHIVVHHLSTFTHLLNLIEIEETVCGWADVPTYVRTFDARIIAETTNFLQLSYETWKFTERNPVFTIRSVNIFTQRNHENSLNAIHCLRHEAWKFGYTRQMATLNAPKLLVLTNLTELTLTVTLTLTDTVTVIFLRAFRSHQ